MLWMPLRRQWGTSGERREDQLSVDRVGAEAERWNKINTQNKGIMNNTYQLHLVSDIDADGSEYLLQII